MRKGLNMKMAAMGLVLVIYGRMYGKGHDRRYLLRR